MKLTILSANPIETKYNNAIGEKPILNDDSDIVVVYSDDYFDDNLFNQLKRLKRKYLAVFAIMFNSQDLLAYNEQYLEFCFENNIGLLDYNQKEAIDQYLENNLIITENYSKFIKYYQDLQPQINYDSWFKEIDFKQKSVVDLGCGIPNYLDIINPDNYHGYDLSKEMIKSAKNEYPQYTFSVNDIMRCEYRADIVISILDVINYLPNIEAVKSLLTSIYNNLNEGGVLIFDIHQKSVLHTFKDYFDFEDNDDEQFVWESKTDNHKIIHYFQIIDKDYKVYIEKHYQQYYDCEIITKHLNEVGFKDVEVINDYNHHIIRAKKESNE